MSSLEKQRQDFVSRFIDQNGDLADRMRKLGVSTVLNPDENVLSLTVGPVQEAMSFSSDGELYLRVESKTHKLVSAELHFFTENLQKQTLPFRLMCDLIQMAGSVRLTVATGEVTEPRIELDRNLRELVGSHA